MSFFVSPTKIVLLGFAFSILHAFKIMSGAGFLLFTSSIVTITSKYFFNLKWFNIFDVMNWLEFVINPIKLKNIKECVRLFDIMDSDKRYKLIVLPTGRFNFEESKNDFILSKVLNKRLVKSGKIQLNLYNGENVISDKKINVGDSVELDFDCKIRKVLPLKEGAKILVSSGKNIGRHGTVRFIDGKKVNAVLDNKKEAELDVRHIFVI